jgi:hypothetical protein
MNKDLIKTLVVLGLVIAGMAVSIAFFTSPRDTEGPTPVVTEEIPVITEVSTDGSFMKEGDISSLSTDMLSISAIEGEFRVRISGARIFDESGNTVALAYLSRGIRVSVKGSDGVAEEIKVISSPDIIVFSPSKDDPVGLLFKIDGSSRSEKGSVSLAVKNRRTGSVYFEGSSPVSTVSRYGSFSFSINLSSSLDIIDGDMLDAELFHLSAGGTKTGNISVPLRYAGGLSSRIKVYFVKSGQCGSVVSVDRLIDASKSAVRSGIEEMIKGPSPAEVESGFATAIPSTSKIRSLELREGAIYVDFNAEILKNGPVCSSATVRRQLTEMIMQFPGISKVIISTDGEETSL